MDKEYIQYAGRIDRTLSSEDSFILNLLDTFHVEVSKEKGTESIDTKNFPKAYQQAALRAVKQYHAIKSLQSLILRLENQKAYIEKLVANKHNYTPERYCEVYESALSVLSRIEMQCKMLTSYSDK